MKITVELPDDLFHQLEAKWKDLPRAVLESVALEAYRSEALTAAQLQTLLGYQTRYELDGFLKDHGVYLEYTLEELDGESEISRQLWERRQEERSREERNQTRRAG